MKYFLQEYRQNFIGGGNFVEISYQCLLQDFYQKSLIIYLSLETSVNVHV